MDAEDVDEYALTVAVFNSAHVLVETVQRQVSPLILSPPPSQILLWPNAYHMMLPLDIAEEEFYLLVSFERKRHGQATMLSWGKLSIEKSTLNATVLQLDMERGEGAPADGDSKSGPFQRIEFELIINKREILNAK